MNKTVVLAFSGGLDTSWCALRLREQGLAVHALTVNTGGFDDRELAIIETRARQAGAADFRALDARAELFDDYIRFLIFGNVLRGETYPLCVSVERVAQARACARYARQIGAAALAHGSTGAGNDQVRFDTAFRVYAPGLAVLAPVREQSVSREQETADLARAGIHIPPGTTQYSVNRGLWGATIGGGPTHRSDGELPEDAYVLTAPMSRWPLDAEVLTLRFDRGIPTALNGEAMPPVALIEALNERGGRHGVGRGVHVGDTILGIKGRVAFEAPAAAILIAAHRELEKLVLSRQQLTWKRTLADLYGAMLHEARFFDPLLRDIEAFLASSQQRVTGEVRVRLRQGSATVLGATSPRSLLGAAGTKYGEESALWTAAEAAAFSKLYGMQDFLIAAAAAGEDADAPAN